MKCEFTVSNGSQRLILIFAGWGTEASFYRDIEVEGYDVLVVSGYLDFDFPTEILEPYHTVCLFAWSLGVYMASATIPPHKLAMAVAVNGTETPVSDTMGIPETVFSGTATWLDQRNLLKFRKRMAGQSYADIATRLETADLELARHAQMLSIEGGHVEMLRRELLFIADHPGRAQASFVWDRAYISLQDSIFPPANMQAAWEAHPSRPEITSLDAPHAVDMARAVRGLVPCTRKVGDRFRQALGSYADNASVQKSIARHLLDLLPSESSFSRTLEIGPGAGLLTTEFARRFKPSMLDLVDLYRLQPFRTGAAERYFTADAEDWLAERAGLEPCSYDAVVSASAVQWFVNPERWLRNACRLLRPGGVLAFATFMPGNFPEMGSMNPFGLLYRTPERLASYLSPLFDTVHCESAHITLDFDSPRHAMSHLRATGVAGSAPSSLPLRDILTRMPSSLTYRPLYIVARKKF